MTFSYGRKMVSEPQVLYATTAFLCLVHAHPHQPMSMIKEVAKHWEMNSLPKYSLILLPCLSNQTNLLVLMITAQLELDQTRCPE